jgi:eukaryotic-like serine/threonine-protein kinase
MPLCPTCQGTFLEGQYCPKDGSRLVPDEHDGEAGTLPADPLVGQILSDRFRIVARLGSGGMGTVYEAEHVYIKKRVALKLLHAETMAHPDAMTRFQREALAASTIGHENIVAIDDFGRLPDGQVYLTMEFLDGLSLADLLRHGPMPLEQVLDVAIQTCHGLGAAHAQGIIHRDMKPENIYLVDGLGRVKILDFGIAKVVRGDACTNLTKTGAIFGTPNYMAPEQALGRRIDHRVDIYSMGVILYEMLTGQLPFRSDSFVAILTQHVMEPPEPPRRAAPERGIPVDVEALVLRAMEKDPAARVADMREMVSALVEMRRKMFGDAPMKSHLRISRIHAPAPPPPGAPETAAQRGKVTATSGELVPPLARPHRWRGLVVGVSLGVTVACIGTVAAFIWLRKPETPSAGEPRLPLVDQGPRPATEAKRVTVLISSEPQGATVERPSGRKIGHTPLALHVVPGEKISVAIRRDGFTPAAVELVARDGLVHVEKLEPRAAPPKVTKIPKAKTRLAAKQGKQGKQGKKGIGPGDDHSSDHGSDGHEVMDPYP